MLAIDWTDLSKKYKGHWIALKNDEKTVVASGKNAVRVYDEALKKGVEIPILYKVPTVSGIFVGQFRWQSFTIRLKKSQYLHQVKE